MSDDSGERSEKASEQKIKKARKKGQISKSQDLTAWLGIAAATLTMPGMIGTGANAGKELIVKAGAVMRHPDPQLALNVLIDGLAVIPAMILPTLIAVAIVAVAGAAVQGGIHLRGVQFKFEHLNVVQGIKRVFGMRALWEGAKALLKTAAVGLALWLVISGLMPVLTASGAHPLQFLMDVAAGGTTSLLVTAVAVGIGLAAVDVMVVMKRNRKHTRSTKKEAKDEHKNAEGDPHIKSQRRARQMAMSRNRMIAAVADSDVVLVNPTHIAVALRYEPGKSAPRVVAKGQGIIAERIRDRATEAGVPLVKDVPLARTLHKVCEVGHEIPTDLYNAVAAVLVFVDSLKRRGAARGVHTLPRKTT